MHENAKVVLFLLMDVGIYVVALSVSVESLRLLLKLLARNQGAEERSRSLLATLCTLGIAYLVQVTLMPKIGFATFPIIVLSTALIIHFVCWPSFTRSIIITAIWLTIMVVTLVGLTSVADRRFPNRRTLGQDIARSQSVLKDMKNATGTKDELLQARTPKEVIDQIKLGLKTWSTALISAVALLKDKDSVNKMTAEHTEALRELDLIADEGPTTAELATLGIHEGSDMTDAEKLRFQLMDKNATDDDRFKVLMAFVDDHSEEGKGPVAVAGPLRNLPSVDATPEMALDIQRMIQHAVTGEKDTSLLDVPLLLHNLPPGTGFAGESATPVTNSGSLASLTITVLSTEPTLGTIASPANTNGETPLLLQDGTPVLPLPQTARATMPRGNPGATKPRIKLWNTPHEVQVTGTIKMSGGKLAVLCNGDIVPVGGIIQVEEDGKSRYWKLRLIRNGQPLWSWERSGDTTTKDIGTHVLHNTIHTEDQEP
ncbi:MAG TPA: hypothetical protein PLE77_06780 [Kiritimatiellia bacterium]|nr:hypothetical protein [Kiritimatiellia bacterium]